MKIISTLTVLTLVVLSAGCSVEHTFAGADSQQVWTALVAAAESPDYTDQPIDERWTVRENEVWIDPEVSRLEVYRQLERRRVDPVGRRPVDEQREWRIGVELVNMDPPVARVRGRGWVVPAHVWRETDRYIADVEALLDPTAAPASEPATPDPAATSAPATAPVEGELEDILSE